MAEDGDTRHAMYQASISANMRPRRGRLPNHPEAQLHQLTPSAPGVFDPSSVIDLTEEPDDYLLRSTVATQPPQQPRQPAPYIDLTGLPDSPTQTQYREAARSQAATSHWLPPWLTNGIFRDNWGSFMDPTTHSSYRRSAHNNPATSRVGSQPSATMSGPAFNLLSQSIFKTSPNHKPRTPSPPPTRAGFTRNTRVNTEKDDETVAICPACYNELAYDPADTVLHCPANTSTGKRKRAPEERHFWALKNCGHVYCANCYTKRNGVDLRALDEKSPYFAAADFGCAVEGCNTRVSTENDWVGIYV
ncbi:hypothetical protein FOPG_19375 [Fusarium oxysporum f. sp. conglutinans race 2 54008]|uniref:Cell cycle control protein n=3 Tax=Fusarium oxysporum f. sp. conglutinans TaxID=100902 RepID=A0A8H6LQD8_FUSOX|nr:hypothetical protein FOXB_03322 [Fusarium oxysporum f. sp. conglutinans Fo5176]EXL64359.1 hypothetical protein FOPG_19375 [Fusarium oxysporum f. sp. conglutinans race 2 54008]KAF6528574.1 hypothetical protein HZS61_008876 [Fusarium oxysporum f. sp. conglutinans]KAI8416073.1 hypothetical protein FOFC_02382 [Fusarium oxysporum]